MRLLLSTFLLYLSCNANAAELLDIPSDLSLGAATSALQIEGAWNESGKSESVWDRFLHENPLTEENGVNVDVTADSYHKFKEDVELLKELGLNHYRFSISWPRILPTGYSNNINEAGVAYYHRLLDELEKYNITPYVTLYHFDHPQVFQDLGGWTSDVIVDLFGDYARVVFKEFGDRVKVFGTINEPTIYCRSSYENGDMAPGLSLGKAGYYLCIHNTLKAHARAYHIYDDEFRATQNGKIGIVQHCSQYYPATEDDAEAAEIAWQYDCGLVGHPIFSEAGDYHPEIKRRIAANSEYEGLERSRLPTFSQDWIDYIRGSSDYLGLIHYLVATVALSSNTTYYENEIGVVTSKNSGGDSDALVDLLVTIKEEYNDIPVYIMEVGSAETELEDTTKANNIYSNLNATLVAKQDYDCNIKAFTVWSLIDTFELNRGTSSKYGLVKVDFESENRPRTVRKSGKWYASVATSRKLQEVPQ